MITGRAEEVVKRREHELTRSLLAETCTIKDQEDSKTYSQVKVFSFAMKPISKTDLLNQQLERSDFSENGVSLQFFGHFALFRHPSCFFASPFPHR